MEMCEVVEGKNLFIYQLYLFIYFIVRGGGGQEAGVADGGRDGGGQEFPGIRCLGQDGLPDWGMPLGRQVHHRGELFLIIP